MIFNTHLNITQSSNYKICGYETAFQNSSTNIMKCSYTCLHENVLQFFNTQRKYVCMKMYLKNTIYKMSKKFSAQCLQHQKI